MSVVVSCNLPDGVILGADSAITLPGPPVIPGQPLPPNVMHGGVLKVYEDADKLFALGERPIGVATYGVAVIGNRTVGNYLREFVVRDPNQVVTGQTTVQEVAEELRRFFTNLYQTIVVPAVEQFQQRPFDQVPEEARPWFGFVVGGFSANAYLSEVWLVVIPLHSTPNSAQCLRAQGDFNSNWYALYDPIHRYIKGWSQALVTELIAHFEGLRGAPLTPAERQQVDTILAKHEFVIPVAAMPVPIGIEYTRFLVELVVNHHRYAIGAPVVGGRAKIGKVTYLGGRFEIVE